MEIKSPEKDENTTDWFDESKFKKILDIVASNQFNHKNKIGEFKYNEIKGLINNIKNNTISEIHAKKKLNTLNETKKAELKKYKICTPTQKELLNLFDDLLKTILNDNDNDNNDNDNDNDNENKNENKNRNKNENKNRNKHDNMIKKLNDYLDKIIGKSKSL